MDLRQLEYFVAVAEEGGFGRAAQRLNIVQSAVSQQISRLERQIGAVLFNRSTRHVYLSGAGERLLPEARAVLAAAQRARQVAADVANGIDGVLRLGAIHGPGDRLYRTLNELSVVAPRLRVRLTHQTVVDRLTAVHSARLDAALIRAQASAPGLELLPVWTEPLYAALPADHTLAGLPILGLEQLADLPLRLAPRDRNPPFYDLITDACRTAGIQPPSGPPFTRLHETLNEIATGTPSWTIFYSVSGIPPVNRVAFRRLAEPTMTTSLAVRSGRPSPGVRHLLAALHRAEQAR